MSSSPTDTPASDAAAELLDTGEVVLVTMPQMGVSVAEGTVVAWHKQVGDLVRAEETICEISTDKIDTEVPSPATGRVTRIVTGVDRTVPVGAVLAIIEPEGSAGGTAGPVAPAAGAAGAVPAEGADIAAAQAAAAEADSAPAEAAARLGEAPAAPVTRAARNAVASAGPAADGKRSLHYTPVVLRIAEREDVDLAQVTGTGRDGRVSKQDVLAFVAAREQARAAGVGAQQAGPSAADTPLHIESPYREDQVPAAAAARAKAPVAAVASAAAPAPGRPLVEPMSRMRRSIAEHMVRSQHLAATCTTVMEADMSAVTVTRTRLGLSPLPFVARCTVDALLAHPQLNTTIEGDTLMRYGEVHLGIAVSLGEHGLIVPVIRDAQRLSVTGLADEIATLARRARAGELSPDDVRGGTFTITNPGGFGTFTSTPIINQPQVGILDVEAVVKRPVVVTDAQGRESIAIRPMVNLCLSFDHRALDGALAAQFLATLRRRLESWDTGA